MFCQKCGAQNEQGAVFCAKCGARMGAEAAPPPSPYAGTPTAYVPQKKKMEWWKILLIVAAIAIPILIGIGIGLFAVLGGDSDAGTISGTPYSQGGAAETPSVPYTAGEIRGNVYTNEWANLRLEIPEGYRTADGYQETGTDAEYGFFLLSPEQHQFTLGFEDISAAPNITEEAYLNRALKYASENDEVLSAGIEYVFDGNYQTAVIAGEEYCVAHVKVRANGLQFIQSLYARKLQDHMCFIIAINMTAEENAALVSQIQPMN